MNVWYIYLELEQEIDDLDIWTGDVCCGILALFMGDIKCIREM